MNIIVIGAGINGLCIATNLAARGANVTLLEQGDIPHSRAASFDQHRAIRPLYPGLDPGSHLTDRAFAAWNDLWQKLGRTHLAETGVLTISTESGDRSDRARTSLEACGIEHELLAGAELRRRLPQLHVADSTVGLFMPRGGVLFADRICTDLARWLRKNAVDLLPRHKVVSIEPARGQVMIDSGEIFAADKIVASCGAWLGNVLPDFTRDMTTLRQAVLYLTPPAALAEAWARSPVIADFGGDAGAYAMPPVQGCDLKIAALAHRRPGDPDHDGSLCFDEAESILHHVSRHLVDAESYRQLYLKTCFYTLAAVDRFQLRRQDKLIIFNTCAGHGFAFGALIGEMLAETVLEKTAFNETERVLNGS